ncbi:MAG TPA: hypothetical protein VHG30_11165 [Microvirga sp.]|nr:hypothetical protein [Microvirga sp.]
MAKKKAKKSGSKTIGGVKLPKALRGSSLGTLLTSDVGREILADALIAAAGAAAAALTRTRAAKDAGHAIAEAAPASADAVQTAAGAVANVVTHAAKSFLPSALVGEGGPDLDQKPRYLHKASDHMSRKRSKKSDKDDGEGKKRARPKKEG